MRKLRIPPRLRLGIGLLSVAIACLALFQNCGQGFVAVAPSSFVGASSNPGASPTPTPRPSASPGPSATASPTPTSTPQTTPAPTPQATATPQPNGQGALFTVPAASGSVQVTLHPSSQAATGTSQTVIFGMPFPKGAVSDPQLVRVTDATGQEIPSQVTTLSSWRDFSSPATAISIRSSRIVIQLAFSNTTPQELTVHYGSPRSRNLQGTFDTRSTWQSIASGPNPTEYPASASVMEPRVYVTLPVNWLSQALLKTRVLPVNSDARFSSFDSAFLRHTATAAGGTSYQTTAEPWLYDRAQTFFIAYFRTGDVTQLRRAHRAAQFYKAQITSSGTFALGGDAKYVYGQSMLYDLLLSGDTTLVSSIENATLAHRGWPTSYTASTGFWTERNAAYALQAALAAFEATGSATHATRARALFNGYFSMQQTPINGWQKNGCPLHTGAQHDPSELDDGMIPEVMCSPWMGALLSDAVWKYYLLSLDNNALIFVADYADYLHLHALYSDGGARLPYYGASSYGHGPEDGDVEHTCDVMGAFVRGYWAKRALGRANSAAMTSDRDALITACQENVSSSSISPLRKFNWWFGTNSDFSWFMNAL